MQNELTTIPDLNDENNKTIAVVYHDADFDGLLSRLVCKIILERRGHTVITFGWDYGKIKPMPDWNKFDEIYVVDLNIAEFQQDPHCAMPNEGVIWIDHHISSIEAEKAAGRTHKGYQLDGVAACRLAFQYLLKSDRTNFECKLLPSKDAFISRRVQEPEILRLAGEYDVWDNRDANARPFQYALRSVSSEQLEKFVNEEFNFPFGRWSARLTNIVNKGHALLEFETKNTAGRIRSLPRTVHWEGLTFCVLNTQGNSITFDSVVAAEHDALMMWYQLSNGTVKVSLYHRQGREDIDLSQIARRMIGPDGRPGGGHKGACGFQCTSLSAFEALVG